MFWREHDLSNQFPVLGVISVILIHNASKIDEQQ
jgi:hypothetical protein